METLIKRCVTFSHIKELHSHFVTAGHLQSSFLRSRLLDRCAVSPFGDLSVAVEIFRRIPKPLTNDWNAIIRGYAASSQPSLAFSWYRSMLSQASSSSSLCRVDALTCSFALKACARALCSSATAQLHAQINRRGLFADALLCTTLLDAYSKNGDLISAHKLFDEMPMRDVASWNALIAGLASGNRAHEALEFDKSHEQWRKIYEKIDEIRFKIREDGYVAQTGLVLHDIGEEEKENALCYHSEKLAVAYGLMMVEEGAGDETPVRVIKNLRICGDCHLVFKHISKIYKREIVVRDRVRFHRFKDGSCSCKDYW
ncbi:Pentatricopeptide repeat-containing protein [Hirschfeldia incana]|nr:Pentatricopeptide repeat-containing protein [Hirschfeldia incana]